MRRAAIVAPAWSRLGTAAARGRAARGARGTPRRRRDRAVPRPLCESDGRVVRHDQGGDTVSEGQAYALLLTAATGRRSAFARVWGWTRAHLQRPDGLLAWRWASGRVVATTSPPPDADLDAARALLVAAGRFRRPAYRAAALRIGAGSSPETARVGGRLRPGRRAWARARAS